MPEELKYPFEDFLEFAGELDMADLDAVMADFVDLVKQFKVKLPKKLAELREKAEENDLQISGSNFGLPDDLDFVFVMIHFSNSRPSVYHAHGHGHKCAQARERALAGGIGHWQRDRALTALCRQRYLVGWCHVGTTPPPTRS